MQNIHGTSQSSIKFSLGGKRSKGGPRSSRSNKSNRSIYSWRSNSSLFVDDEEDQSKQVVQEKYYAGLRKQIPKPIKPFKQFTISTSYLSRSNTIGLIPRNATLFDDYFTLYINRSLFEIPMIKEVKVFFTPEKILGLQTIYRERDEEIVGHVYIGSEADDVEVQVASLQLQAAEFIEEVSGTSEKFIDSLRFRTSLGQVLEVGNNLTKKFKPLFDPRYRLMFLGGAVNGKLCSLYAYF